MGVVILSPNSGELLLPREVASMFRVTIRTLGNWERRGFLTPVRLPSGQRRYRRSEIEAVTEEGKHVSKPERGGGS
ncbi:MerR family DNA-binding transcriptional regulator [Desulfofundulus salinus]|uniref:MerR family DNA-binding transcriptional regulator n=1 Tax=Desulfofundulus salinus TaxID=2419843 RepID=A0A494WUV1_9FIRM|nr:MerR family DNA-binding transcriptional regulator [Desulfofundulus salinum]